VASRSGGVRELTTGGPPLGIVAEYEYLEESMACGDGCALMYTDGLVEARNASGELLGAEAVKWTLSEARRLGQSAAEIRRILVTLLQTFERDAAPADDTAFIVIAENESIPHG
jgi:serine phosphatase RsbU (regulator of sigma subunit)